MTPPPYGGFISVWAASKLKDANRRALEIERFLEQTRELEFPICLSRLRGMFCFRDLLSAERALGSAMHFRQQSLVGLSTRQAKRSSGPFDGNWIAFAAELTDVEFQDKAWRMSYWKGDPCPVYPYPIWESLIEGTLIVFGTEVRGRAYSVVKKYFPESLTLLEISRIASWLGSSLGNLSAHLRRIGHDTYECDYAMDMRDANNPSFLNAVKTFINSKNPVNWADITPNFERDSFGKTIDLSSMKFTTSGAGLSLPVPYGHLWSEISGRMGHV